MRGSVGFPRGGAPLDQSCVGAWSMWQEDLVDATHIRDLSANGNNGTLVGNPTFTTDHQGVANRALNFNGTTQRINMGNIPNISYPSSLSIWMYSEYTVNSQVYVCFDAHPNHAFFSHFNWDPFTNYGRGGTDYGYGEGRHLRSIYRRPGDQWNFIAVVRPDNTFDNAMIYIDGGYRPATLINDGGSQTALWTNMRVGLSLGNTFPFKGSITDLRLYNRALTASEIKILAMRGR